MVRQLTWANLEMSKNLKAVDPPSIGRLGAATLAAADELQRKSDALSALAGRLRQPGSWLSPAATVFVNAAHEQAAHVRVISDFMHDLGQALTTLAAEVGSAKADAMAAVARSRQLDHAGDELNARVSAQHALLPLGPDSPPGAESEAADLAAGQSSASTALWGAEHRAIDAWRRAGAAFDFVSSRTPAMIKKTLDPTWDPNDSVFLARATAMSSGSLAAFGLPTGGMITGPDGRPYPLDLQTSFGRDGSLLVTSRDNPAKNGDWHVIGERDGVTSYGEKAANWQKIGVLLGATAGASYPEGSTFQSAMLGDLQLMGQGGAFLMHGGQEPGASVKEASGEPQRGKGNELWNPPSRGIAAGKTAATPDAVGLVDGVLAGISMSRHLDDARAAAYHVVFEEDSMGNRRAVMQLYRVTGVPGAPHGVDKQAAYVDDHGKLAATPVTGEDPDLPPILIPGA
jgi:hypothetical protein